MVHPIDHRPPKKPPSRERVPNSVIFTAVEFLLQRFVHFRDKFEDLQIQWRRSADLLVGLGVAEELSGAEIESGTQRQAEGPLQTHYLFKNASAVFRQFSKRSANVADMHGRLMYNLVHIHAPTVQKLDLLQEFLDRVQSRGQGYETRAVTRPAAPCPSLPEVRLELNGRWGFHQEAVKNLFAGYLFQNRNVTLLSGPVNSGKELLPGILFPHSSHRNQFGNKTFQASLSQTEPKKDRATGGETAEASNEQCSTETMQVFRIAVFDEHTERNSKGGSRYAAEEKKIRQLISAAAANRTATGMTKHTVVLIDTDCSVSRLLMSYSGAETRYVTHIPVLCVPTSLLAAALLNSLLSKLNSSFSHFLPRCQMFRRLLLSPEIGEKMVQRLESVAWLGSSVLPVLKVLFDQPKKDLNSNHQVRLFSEVCYQLGHAPRQQIYNGFSTPREVNASDLASVHLHVYQSFVAADDKLNWAKKDLRSAHRMLELLILCQSQLFEEESEQREVRGSESLRRRLQSALDAANLQAKTQKLLPIQSEWFTATKKQELAVRLNFTAVERMHAGADLESQKKAFSRSVWRAQEYVEETHFPDCCENLLVCQTRRSEAYVLLDCFHKHLMNQNQKSDGAKPTAGKQTPLSYQKFWNPGKRAGTAPSTGIAQRLRAARESEWSRPVADRLTICDSSLKLLELETVLFEVKNLNLRKYAPPSSPENPRRSSNGDVELVDKTFNSWNNEQKLKAVETIFQEDLKRAKLLGVPMTDGLAAASVSVPDPQHKKTETRAGNVGLQKRAAKEPEDPSKAEQVEPSRRYMTGRAMERAEVVDTKKRLPQGRQGELQGFSRHHALWYAYDRRVVICQLDEDAKSLAEESARSEDVGDYLCERPRVAHGSVLVSRLAKIACHTAWEQEAMMWLSTLSVFLRDVFPAVISKACYGEEQRYDVTEVLFWKRVIQETFERFEVTVDPDQKAKGPTSRRIQPDVASDDTGTPSSDNLQIEEQEEVPEDVDRFRVSGTVKELSVFFQILYQETVYRFFRANKFAQEKFEKQPWPLDMRFRFSMSRGKFVPIMRSEKLTGVQRKS